MKPIICLVSLLLSSACAIAEQRRPNLIIINIDDLGYGDIGPFGSKTPTPELDRMAREGRRLASHYAAPICSPSRAALMTGCYPKRVLPISHVLFPQAIIGLNPEEWTVADILQDAGYATACIGKWHLGDQPEFLPPRQGFSYYFGLPYSNDMGPAEDGVKSNPGKSIPPSKPSSSNLPVPVPEDGIRGDQPPLPLIENEMVVGRIRANEQHELTRLYTEKSIQYIREHTTRPFFLYLAHAAVHFPIYPGRSYLGASGKGLLADWVTEVDWSVGRILTTLRELNLDENTLVLFTSDNGGATRQGSVNLPLRGSKGEIFEGGVRTCTIAWWPKHIPAGTSTNAITSMMDVLPTFARLAGASLAPNRKIDGVDLWPVLAGESDKEPRDTFFYYRGLKLEAIRSGPWKLHLGNGELYQLINDVGEARNVAAENPAAVHQLRALAEKMAEDLGLDGIGPGCRPLGRVSAARPLIELNGKVRDDYSGTASEFR